MVTSKDVVLSCLLMNGAIPSAIWKDTALSSNDIRVFNEILSRCIYLLGNKIPHKTTPDGGPTFYEKKASFSKRCFMSDVTLRGIISKLMGMGLVYIGNKSTADGYVLGVSVEYFERNFDFSRLNGSRLSDCTTLKSIESFLRLSILSIYNYIKYIKYINIDRSIIEDLFDLKDTSPSEEGDSKAVYETVNLEENKISDGIKRVPILKILPEFDRGFIIKRVPILTPVEYKDVSTVNKSDYVTQMAKNKLQELGGYTSVEDKKILELARYYEYKVRKCLNKTGFRALTQKNPQEHKNWKFFKKTWELCNENKWDYRVYLDAQFDRASYWKHSKYPFANQIYGEGAQKYYQFYLKEHAGKHEYDEKKLKGHSLKSVTQEVIESIMKDCETVLYHINLMKKNKRIASNNLPDSDIKVSVIFDKWMNLSPYYLSCIDWFAEVFEEYYSQSPENQHFIDYKEKFEMIRKSKKLQKTIQTTVEEMENHYNIPHTMSMEDVLNVT